MKQITLRLLQNAEHFALMTDAKNLLAEAAIPQLADIKTRIETLVAQEDAAQQQIKKSEHTQALVSLDEKRDNLYRGMVLRLQSELLSQDAAAVSAAGRLMIVVDTYGNFTEHNYGKETAELYNLLQDLKSAAYTADADTAGIKTWIQWLDAANSAFDALYNSRRDENAAKPMYDLKIIRKDLDEAFREMQKMADALKLLSPSAALDTFTTRLDTSIQHWKDVLAQRRGRKNNGDDTGEDNPTKD